MPPSSRSTRPPGFTLLELMTVVAIVAIMVAISVAGFGGLNRRNRAKGAVRELYAQMLSARVMARSRGLPVRFSVINATEDAKQYRYVRWNQLEWGDTWGRTTSAPACESSACGVGGCVCPLQGEIVKVPVEVTLPTGLTGLCFLGASARPKGTACDDAGADVTALRFDISDEPGGEVIEAPYFIQIEPLSGIARFIDCGHRSNDPGEPEREALCP